MEEKANWELKKSFSYLVMGMELCGRARLASYLSIYLSFRGRPKPLGTHSHSRFNSNKIGFHDFLFLFSIWFFFLPHWSIHTHTHSVSLKRLLQPIYLLPLINEITPSNDKQSPSHSFFFLFINSSRWPPHHTHTHIYIRPPLLPCQQVSLCPITVCYLSPFGKGFNFSFSQSFSGSFFFPFFFFLGQCVRYGIGRGSVSILLKFSLYL